MADDRKTKRGCFLIAFLLLFALGVGFAIKNAPKKAEEWTQNWHWITRPIVDDLEMFDGARVLRNLDQGTRYCDVDYRAQCLVTERIRTNCTKQNILSPLAISDAACKDFLADRAYYGEAGFPYFEKWPRSQPLSILESVMRFVAGVRYAIVGAFTRAPKSALVLFGSVFLLSLLYLTSLRSVTFWTFVWVPLAAVGLSAAIASAAIWVYQRLDPYIEKVMLAIALLVAIVGAYLSARKRALAAVRSWRGSRMKTQASRPNSNDTDISSH